MELVPQTGASRAEWILITTLSQRLPVPALLLENCQETFQLRLHNVRLVSCRFSFINSVCSKLYS